MHNNGDDLVVRRGAFEDANPQITSLVLQVRGIYGVHTGATLARRYVCCMKHDSQAIEHFVDAIVVRNVMSLDVQRRVAISVNSVKLGHPIGNLAHCNRQTKYVSLTYASANAIHSPF
jgi:hypothetical protein